MCENRTMAASPTPAADAPGFDGILDVHDQIEAALEAHQAELVAAGMTAPGFAHARELFAVFAVAQHAHIEAENTVLIPLFEELCPPQNGCTPDILLAEHRKIARLLEEMTETLAAFGRRALEPLEIVALIERQRLLKEVLDHHGVREEARFVPRLAEALTGERRLKVLAECDAIHHRADVLCPVPAA
jgi:hypothetical protein